MWLKNEEEKNRTINKQEERIIETKMLINLEEYHRYSAGNCDVMLPMKQLTVIVLYLGHLNRKCIYIFFLFFFSHLGRNLIRDKTCRIVLILIHIFSLFFIIYIYIIFYFILFFVSDFFLDIPRHLIGFLLRFRDI